ncbi:MAG: energy transducer TonB [Nitrospirota bacterium]|nr:energy transducer TonB [Nitrospirota bacterium]
MNYQLKGFRFSFLFHGAVLLAFFGLNNSMAQFSNPVLIDFSIEDSIVKGDPKAPPAPKKQEVKTVKPEPQKPAVEKQEVMPQKALPEQVTATSETSPESQAPVAAKPVASTPPATTTATSAGNTMKAEGNASPVSRGNSADGLKQGYLKEHFAYIRNYVQKKLSYPKIARKMGWEGKVLISFVVCTDGHAKDITIKEGSGFELLDKNAISAVQMASPFPKPPIEAQLIIPINYSLN